MVKITFDGCEYHTIKDNNSIVPIVQMVASIQAGFRSSGEMSYLYDEDGNMYEDNSTQFNIVTVSKYKDNPTVDFVECGRIMFEIDVDEDDFDASKIAIDVNDSDNIDLKGWILDHIYYDGKLIEHPFIQN